jgi:hypothetical protein
MSSRLVLRPGPLIDEPPAVVGSAGLCLVVAAPS